MAIASPYELLELQDGQSVLFRVDNWEEGTAVIRPAHAPQGKTVAVIRVHVPVGDKPTFPHYWDLTSARLVAQIRPHLLRSDFKVLIFRITARGHQQKKTFELDITRA